MKLDKDQIKIISEVVEQVLTDVFTTAKQAFHEVVQEEFGQENKCGEPLETTWLDVDYAPAENGKYLVRRDTGISGSDLVLHVADYKDGKWGVSGVVKWTHIPR